MFKVSEGNVYQTEHTGLAFCVSHFAINKDLPEEASTFIKHHITNSDDTP